MRSAASPVPASPQPPRRPGLRPQIIVALGLLWSIVLFAQVTIVKRAVEDGFSKVEAADAERHLDRLRVAFELEFDQLASAAVDWAEWDDAYDFSTGKSQAFVEDNVNPESFARLRIDGLVVLAADSTVLLAKEYTADASLVGIHSDLVLAIQGAGPGKHYLAAGGIWEAACLPIRRSDGSGDAAGTLCLARRLDTRVVPQIQLTASNQLRLESPDGTSEEGKQPIDLSHADRAFGTLVLRGPTDQPIAVVVSESERPIQREAAKVLGILVLLLLVSASVSLLIGLAFIELRVIRPIRRLVSDLNTAGQVRNTIEIDHSSSELMQLSETVSQSLKSVAQAEIAEKQREVAERAAETRSFFLARISHEMRTPLNGVLGMVEVLGETGLTERQRQILATVAASATSLLTLINDVLDLSKIESGKLTLSSELFRPALVGRDVLSMLEPTAKRKGIRLLFRADLSEEQTIVGDPIRLHQVLVNLLGNAVKFTDQGEVRLNLQIVPLASEELGLQFRVKDTGPGIAASVLPRLFTPFVQGPQQSATRAQGTGLGLSIARELVLAMGGRLEVESQEGEGSEFRFTLPFGAVDLLPAPTEEARTSELGVATKSEGSPPAVLGGVATAPLDSSHSGDGTAVGHPVGPPTGTARKLPGKVGAIQPKPFVGLRVLVVEDNPVNQQVATSMLTLLGCEATVAEDGLAALESLAASQPDLVLMDCHMPRMDGFEATRRWRAWEAERGMRPLPILALTANATEADQVACREAGMSDFLAKPFSKKALQERIEGLVASMVAPQ